MNFLYCNSQVCFEGLLFCIYGLIENFCSTIEPLPPCFFPFYLHWTCCYPPLLRTLIIFSFHKEFMCFLFLGPGFVWNTFACVSSYFGSLSRLYAYWEWHDCWSCIWWTSWRRYDMSWEECQHIFKYVSHILYKFFEQLKTLWILFGKCFNNYCEEDLEQHTLGWISYYFFTFSAGSIKCFWYY